jgi:hypothetical protein
MRTAAEPGSCRARRRTVRSGASRRHFPSSRQAPVLRRADPVAKRAGVAVVQPVNPGSAGGADRGRVRGVWALLFIAGLRSSRRATRHRGSAASARRTEGIGCGSLPGRSSLRGSCRRSERETCTGVRGSAVQPPCTIFGLNFALCGMVTSNPACRRLPGEVLAGVSCDSRLPALTERTCPYSGTGVRARFSAGRHPRLRLHCPEQSVRSPLRDGHGHPVRRHGPDGARPARPGAVLAIRGGPARRPVGSRTREGARAWTAARGPADEGSARLWLFSRPDA